MLKSSQGTKASRALQDAAREIREARNNLEEQPDAVNQLRTLIKNLGNYSLTLTETGQKIINYIIQSRPYNDMAVSWLQTLPHQPGFVNLLYFFEERLKHLPGQLSNTVGGHIDIVIVAHGEIMNTLMPASLLMPAPTIIDTVLYSPWNCQIKSSAACAIAEGWDSPEGREFYNNSSPVIFRPIPLPFHWNHMQRSLHDVPVILLTPVYPEENVWQMFQELWGHMDIDGRVIIPYVVPQNFVAAFGKMPFFMFIMALSYILMIHNKTATVHLAACLGRGDNAPLPDQWLAQYAYTNDGTVMTERYRDFRRYLLFTAFREMFDMNGR